MLSGNSEDKLNQLGIEIWKIHYYHNGSSSSEIGREQKFFTSSAIKLQQLTCALYWREALVVVILQSERMHRYHVHVRKSVYHTDFSLNDTCIDDRVNLAWIRCAKSPNVHFIIGCTFQEPLTLILHSNRPFSDREIIKVFVKAVHLLLNAFYSTLKALGFYYMHQLNPLILVKAKIVNSKTFEDQIIMRQIKEAFISPHN
ncbi:hypothetical protein EGR_06155 [Echinococcus granulosus]|uniref:Uncharacterized protein n=1 Tax=Echinococcus granulosus TaxID=6210 RepID=W6UDQ0_ECHGR|nr:hypothetical protein EGR_06155 [Echinococcus granulosus]EUB58936.1 hypothetical protein EGR_06155 [Echinococcus granulosus]